MLFFLNQHKFVAFSASVQGLYYGNENLYMNILNILKPHE